MPTTLAIHLGPALAHAAVDRDGHIALVALGDRAAGMPVLLHVSGDGSISAGSEARQRGEAEPDGLVDDVVGRVFDDDVVEVAGITVRVEALLAHLLAHIHARTVRVLDGVPDEVMVVLTAGGPEVPIYSAASIRARIGEVTMVEETRAWSALAAHGPGDVDPDQAGVLGALYWRRHGDGPPGPQPIVTREDLGVASQRSSRPPTAPSVISLGPRSVFEESSPPEGPRRRVHGRLSILLGVVVSLGVLGGLGALLLPFGGTGDPGPTGGSTVIVTTAVPGAATTALEPATTTVPAPATMAPGSVTTTVPAPATMMSATVTSTTLPAAVTTTTLPEVTTTTLADVTTTTLPPLGVVTLSQVGVVTNATTDSEVLVGLGDAAEAVVAVLTTALSAPVTDTGWIEDGLCVGDLTRRVTFGDLEIVLSDADATEGEPGTGATFTQWFASGPNAHQTSLWTYDRIGVGSSVAELRGVYGDGLVLGAPVAGDPAGSFVVDSVGLGDGMRGVTSNTTDLGRILQIWGGDGCSRWPD